MESYGTLNLLMHKADFCKTFNQYKDNEKYTVKKCTSTL